MKQHSPKDLANYRLDDAKEKLDSAKILLHEQHFKDFLSRSYYSMFTAVRALLALKGFDSSKHSGIISLFNQHFVKTRLISSDCGRILKKAQYSRERSDYGDFTVVTRKETEQQIRDAEKLLAEIKVIIFEPLDKDVSK